MKKFHFIYLNFLFVIFIFSSGCNNDNLTKNNNIVENPIDKEFISKEVLPNDIDMIIFYPIRNTENKPMPDSKKRIEIVDKNRIREIVSGINNSNKKRIIKNEIYPISELEQYFVEFYIEKDSIPGSYWVKGKFVVPNLDNWGENESVEITLNEDITEMINTQLKQDKH